MAKHRLAAALAVWVCLAAGSSQAAGPQDAADARIFVTANALCRADGGRLWGVSLCVPMMVVNPATHQALLNRPARGAVRDGDFFRIPLPADVQVSTAPVDFDGRRWAEITWPLYGDAQTHAVTLMHESFHVVQPELGFKGNADNGSIAGDAFLDTRDGRIWLRGELHALRRALQSTGAARKRALKDALQMRLYRDSLSKGTGEQERRLDLLEGLAEGTGIDAGLLPNRRIAYAVRDSAFVEAQPSYARSFPYATGPAYTELLDAAQNSWRRRVTPSSDIARMAAHAYGLNVATPAAARARAVLARYGGKAIETQENARAARMAALDATYKRELVEGPVLTLLMTHFHITFNPRDIETLAPYGTVYHTLTLSAPWGSVTVRGGDALISSDFKSLRIEAPQNPRGSVATGSGWKLRLAPDYTIAPVRADPARSSSRTENAANGRAIDEHAAVLDARFQTDGECPLLARMTDWQIGKYRYAEIAQAVLQRARQRHSGIRMLLVDIALLARTEQHPGGARERTGHTQLRQHAIDAVRRFLDFLEYQQRAARVDFVRRSKKRGDERKIAAAQNAASAARAQNRGLGGRQFAERLGPHDRAA